MLPLNVPTRGLRNNNPGNIRNDDRIGWQGEVCPTAKRDFAFEEFKDMASGYRALLKLLRNYRSIHGLQTIAEFIARWAPPHENDTEAYIGMVCRSLNVARDYVPDVNDREIMTAFAAAISRMENGVPAVMSDVYAGWEKL